MASGEGDFEPDRLSTSVYNFSANSNGTFDYAYVDHHLPKNMELPREYITDYNTYLDVLNECNNSIHRTPYPSDGGLYCNATWDTMQCWDYTPAGTTVFQYCPDYVTLSNPLAYSSKICRSDGTWFVNPETHETWSNYTSCYDKELVEKHKQVIYMYFYGFSISIVLLVISLFIFSYFRQLKCVRVTLHKHLFLSYVLTGALWIAYYGLVAMSYDVVVENPVWCQILHVLTHFFTVCNYAWMFCEGFYLHALIVIAFTKDKKLLVICYIIGWVCPLLPVIIYTCIRVFDDKENKRWVVTCYLSLAGHILAQLGVFFSSDSQCGKRCWTGETDLNWILLGPISASLIINFILAINIMRILLSKLRSVHTNETMQTRRALRAIVILIPLLGLQYILFPFKPPPRAPGEHIYAMISAFLVSFQGVFVSLVFCFFNGEVVALVKRRWHRQRQRSSTYTNPSTQRSSIYTQSRKTDYAMEGTTLLDDTKKDSNENHKRDIGSTGYDDQNMSNSTI